MKLNQFLLFQQFLNFMPLKLLYFFNCKFKKAISLNQKQLLILNNYFHMAPKITKNLTLFTKVRNKNGRSPSEEAYSDL